MLSFVCLASVAYPTGLNRYEKLPTMIVETIPSNAQTSNKLELQISQSTTSPIRA